MKQVKLLDCTLRDGGYVNNWQFGRETIRDMLYRFAKSGADIVECGFLTNPDEAGLLQTEEYQERVAKAIVDGIQSYMGEK